MAPSGKKTSQPVAATTDDDDNDEEDQAPVAPPSSKKTTQPATETTNDDNNHSVDDANGAVPSKKTLGLKKQKGFKKKMSVKSDGIGASQLLQSGSFDNNNLKVWENLLLHPKLRISNKKKKKQQEGTEEEKNIPPLTLVLLDTFSRFCLSTNPIFAHSIPALTGVLDYILTYFCSKDLNTICIDKISIV